MLHLKPETENLTIEDLDAIFNDLCEPKGESEEKGQKVIDLIFEQANDAAAGNDPVSLDTKIVLAIGTRLAAERFMIGRITDKDFVDSITKHQTRKLMEKYRELYPDETETLRILDRVELMTPENIHVNAFMYEPIIDMGDDQLRRLYSDVKALT